MCELETLLRQLKELFEKQEMMIQDLIKSTAHIHVNEFQDWEDTKEIQLNTEWLNQR